MFGAIIRVAVVLVAGSLIMVALSMAAGPFIDVQQDTQPIPSGSQTDAFDGTPNYQWQQHFVDWWPGLVVASVVAMLIGNAIIRRRTVVR